MFAEHCHVSRQLLQELGREPTLEETARRAETTDMQHTYCSLKTGFLPSNTAISPSKRSGLLISERFRRTCRAISGRLIKMPSTPRFINIDMVAAHTYWDIRGISYLEVFIGPVIL